MLWCVFWVKLFYDLPENNPYISSSELALLKRETKEGGNEVYFLIIFTSFRYGHVKIFRMLAFIICCSFVCTLFCCLLILFVSPIKHFDFNMFLATLFSLYLGVKYCEAKQFGPLWWRMFARIGVPIQCLRICRAF